MRKARWFVSAIAFSLSMAGGTRGNEPQALTVDLNGDGKPEKIDWVKFAETEGEGDFYQVRVTGSDGSLLWQGPKVADTGNPLVFGNWHFGYSMPQLAADIDGDGAIEMVTPAPQSDVSPTYFRVVRWQGGRFVPTHSGILLESPRGTGKFPWSEADAWKGTWISSFLGVEANGFLRVQLFEYRGGTDTRIGEASIEAVLGGYEIRKWLKPMRKTAEVWEGDANPAATENVVYQARLSARDHFNSLGKRLNTVADILRQDRANFHQGRGNQGDSGDPIFSTREARDSMEKRAPRPWDGNARSWTEAIVNGTPLVEVEVGASVMKVRILKP